MKPFEIFSAGTHTSSQGATLTFSDADIASIVGGYDTTLHQAPIVVGHPKQDAPAYGWVAGLEAKGNRIVAKPADLDNAFSDLVREGKFRKVSAAFYQPDSPNNPTPGKYYLRHVGFLGAAAPAVKGLKPIEFADDELVVEFADTDWRLTWTLDAIARTFRSIRDWIIETKDIETADKVVAQWDVDQLTQTAAEIRADSKVDQSMFADTEKGNDMKTAATDTARATELDRREAALAAREATFADQERKRRSTEDAAFVADAVKAGRLPVGLQAQATALFADLGDGELTFSDGDDEKKTTTRAAFRDLLEKLPVPVVTKELVEGEVADFNDPMQVAAAITTEMKEAADKGSPISAAEAGMRVSNRS